ncbi:MAG: Xaa-Pro aminopeptidase [Gammaproteobacteria bacterium RIFCSPLOWO2_01_FULL_47_190]|jgi:Xaa-Pro aminopeptidase|nr:MAG: Xaa-Pro aminopeptidase [Gammaproteobacteria bacterium RIFCSPLOWO2_01_FULL_47_190]OGT75871.1 MAG: Xaa-Pro aminopeptidase [Gammaproteobacteria bacterium RIFCSPLOWO2_12_47_11]OGT88012.1 MAG: Xaa-Pro aminopeptidase [Gammaproteobacteria bacterium RIFCSPLOWO2_12_FULL_47_76]
MDLKEYKRRRKKLMDMMGDESIAIIPTASVYIRNRDVEYPFRPDSDFCYLTGYPEPEAVAVLIPDRHHGEYVLFCRENDPVMETWNGRRAGLDGAIECYGADDAFPIGDMDEILPGLLEDRQRIFYTMGNNSMFDQRVLGWVNQVRKRARTGVNAPDEFISPNHLLHEMRLYKSRAEIAAMRKAAKISAAAHRRAMQMCRPGMMEYQIEAELKYTFMKLGAQETAYPPIVGGGANSCILHYTENNQVLNDGDVLLIDAGSEYNGYASDISRTFPVNGKFSSAQREVYELVLKAQSAAIGKIKPGNHWNEPHEAAIEVLTAGMVELGILKGRLRQLIKDQAYTKYYMHRTGHWLGMDVHDVGDYKVEGEWRTFEPGMVMTVEPGIYLPASSKGLAKKWRNIGIRIEDDVLVTRTGNDILSKDAPKSVEEIEAMMAHELAV